MTKVSIEINTNTLIKNVQEGHETTIPSSILPPPSIAGEGVVVARKQKLLFLSQLKQKDKRHMLFELSISNNFKHLPIRICYW